MYLSKLERPPQIRGAGSFSPADLKTSSNPDCMWYFPCVNIGTALVCEKDNGSSSNNNRKHLRLDPHILDPTLSLVEWVYHLNSQSTCPREPGLGLSCHLNLNRKRIIHSDLILDLIHMVPPEIFRFSMVSGESNSSHRSLEAGCYAEIRHVKTRGVVSY